MRKIIFIVLIAIFSINISFAEDGSHLAKAKEIYDNAKEKAVQLKDKAKEKVNDYIKEKELEQKLEQAYEQVLKKRVDDLKREIDELEKELKQLEKKAKRDYT